MTGLLIWASAVLCALLLLQAFWVWRFARMFRDRDTDPSFENEWPRAVVLLSLRGADPFLPDCIRGLLNQKYPSYDVRIIVDSYSDPAWDVVQSLIEEHRGNADVSIRVIEQRFDTCGLRLSAFIQEIESLDETYDVVAYLDADVIPYENWLHDLVAPLADPDVGATTGVRFYQPGDSNWGTLVRYLWNLAALLQMRVFQIAWGGSLALRASVFRESDLLKTWSRIVFEDTHTFDALRSMGLRLRIVPAVTMPNRESIPLDSCYSFIRRQMLNPKLYHSRWPLILALGLIMTTHLAILQILVGVGAMTQNWQLASAAGGVLAAYGLGLGVAASIQSNCMQRVVTARGEPTVAIPLKCAAAGVVVQWMYAWCLLSVLLLRQIRWRGITYDIHGPMDIRIQDYSPYTPAPETADASII